MQHSFHLRICLQLVTLQHRCKCSKKNSTWEQFPKNSIELLIFLLVGKLFGSSHAQFSWGWSEKDDFIIWAWCVRSGQKEICSSAQRFFSKIVGSMLLWPLEGGHHHPTHSVQPFWNHVALHNRLYLLFERWGIGDNEKVKTVEEYKNRISLTTKMQNVILSMNFFTTIITTLENR